MKPVISIVDELLEAGVNVTIYNGQLDLIVDTIGKEHAPRGTWRQFRGVSWKGTGPGQTCQSGLGTLKCLEEGHFLLRSSAPTLTSLKRTELLRQLLNVGEV